MLIPTRVVKTYLSNKPWVTRDVADVLKRKQEAFKRVDREYVKQRQEARQAILESKHRLLDKAGDSFASDSSRQLWRERADRDGLQAEQEAPGC